MEIAPLISARAAELRRDFDQAFALPPVADHAATEDLLTIRLAAKGFALRLNEIAGLFADKKITPVPGANIAMLGIAGFRGSVLPVYDLQSLVGLAASQSSRWLVIAAAEPIAFCFEAFEGQLRVSSDLIKPQQAAASHNFTKDLVQIENALRPIIHLSSVLAAIKT